MEKSKAIRIVLEDAGEPMHYTAIADAILARNLYKTTAKNWYKAVNTDLWKNSQDNPNAQLPWIIRYQRGMYGLAEWQSVPKHKAIRMVLKEAGRPLHYTKIAGAIRKRGLYYSPSKNWNNAVNSDLSKIIRVMKAEGREPWLFRDSPGVYGLTEWKKEKNGDP